MKLASEYQPDVQFTCSRLLTLPSQPCSSGFAAEAGQALMTMTGAGLAIAGLLVFQQFLMQIYTARWQMALLFALIGLITALLLGQCHPGQHQLRSLKPVIQWPALSSLIISLLGIGVIACILQTAPPA